MIPDGFIGVDDVRQVFARVLLQAGGASSEGEPDRPAGTAVQDSFSDEEDWWLGECLSEN